VKLAAPLVIGRISGEASVPGIVGIAFTLAGIASVIGVLFIGRRRVRSGSFVRMLTIGTVLTAIAHVLLAYSMNIPMFLLAFSLILMVQAAMLPPTNTLIASAIPRDRRGTAFGLAASAQALAFMIGPLTAAAFAAVSMSLGFVFIGILFLLLGGLLRWKLREPVLDETGRTMTSAPVV
jgi:MFS family permease